MRLFLDTMFYPSHQLFSLSTLREIFCYLLKFIFAWGEGGCHCKNYFGDKGGDYQPGLCTTFWVFALAQTSHDFHTCTHLCVNTHRRVEAETQICAHIYTLVCSRVYVHAVSLYLLWFTLITFYVFPQLLLEPLKCTRFSVSLFIALDETRCGFLGTQSPSRDRCAALLSCPAGGTSSASHLPVASFFLHFSRGRNTQDFCLS